MSSGLSPRASSCPQCMLAVTWRMDRTTWQTSLVLIMDQHETHCGHHDRHVQSQWNWNCATPPTHHTHAPATGHQCVQPPKGCLQHPGQSHGSSERRHGDWLKAFLFSTEACPWEGRHSGKHHGRLQKAGIHPLSKEAVYMTQVRFFILSPIIIHVNFIMQLKSYLMWRILVSNLRNHYLDCKARAPLLLCCSRGRPVLCCVSLLHSTTQIANILAVLWHSFGIFGFLLALRKPFGLTVVWLRLSIGASNIWLSYGICLVNQKTGQRAGSSIRDGMACLWQARRLSKERQHLIPYMDVFWMCFGIFL